MRRKDREVKDLNTISQIITYFMSSLYQFHSHLFYWIIFMFSFLMIHDSDWE